MMTTALNTPTFYLDDGSTWREPVVRLSSLPTSFQQTDILRGIAHDLLNGLAVINTASAILTQMMHNNPPNSQEQNLALLAQIDACVVRMDHLINGMQQAFEPIPEREALHQCETDLVDVTRRVIADHLASPHHIRFETTVTMLTGAWEPLHLEHILGNLLTNAIKYSPNPSVITVTLTCHEEVRISYAVLAISDEGIGIPSAELPHIFERGYRASNIVDRIGGTGYGLASVQRLVNYYDGDIQVCSSEGAGSTFTLRLPTQRLK